MGSNYIEMRLEDCMDAIIDYRGKTPKKVDNGIPLITAKIIKNGRIHEVNEFIAIDDYDDWMVRGLPLEGDVVLTTEAPLGEVAQLDARKVALAQRVITLRGKKGILENDYLLYLLQSSFVQNQLDGRASGSTVTGIKQSELREIILRLPPVSLQKSISHQLKCLDKKIDLNNKINKTLEQMSQTLFKSWFVDFDPVIDNALDAGNPIPEALQSRAELRQKVRNSADFKPLPAEIRSLFPSEFEETELGWVPKGWKIDNIGGLSDKIFSGGTPNTSTEEYWNGALNWFSSGETRNALIIETEKKITATGVKNSSTRLSVAGDILIASAGQGHTRGQTSLNTIDTYINQSVVCIRPIKPSYSTWLYFNLSSRYTEMRAISDSHSIRGSLTTKLISSMKVASPTDELISLFDINCSVFISKIKNNLELSRELKKLRDTLLPKLISGELSLEDLPDLSTDTEAA